MTEAYLVSLRGTCPRRSVGALLVKDGRPISAGYNGAPPGEDHCIEKGCRIVDGKCQRAIHAEVNCIAEAARMGRSTQDSILYTTDAPCVSCAGLLLSAGIQGMYYHRPYHDPEGLALIQRHVNGPLLQLDPIPLSDLLELVKRGYDQVPQSPVDSSNS